MEICKNGFHNFSSSNSFDFYSDQRKLYADAADNVDDECNLENDMNDITPLSPKAVQALLAHYNNSSTNCLQNEKTTFDAVEDASWQESKNFEKYLLDDFQLRGQVCLVCLDPIDSKDSVWHCIAGCYQMYHLPCIQKWIGELKAIYVQQEDDSRRLPVFVWCCPKCRHEYQESLIPRFYYCFCNKVRNPRLDPWILPHSCGQVCGRLLNGCEHTCLLLCHPGPCPPCPKVIKTSCLCGRSDLQARRCGEKRWTCNRPCDRPLPCGYHLCTSLPCHMSDQCPPCSESSEQPCLCKRETSLRDCISPLWQCKNVCNRVLSCSRHRCTTICHAGDCQPCALQSSRNSCPCGKTLLDWKSNRLSCIDEQVCCGDTCGKLLACGVHTCVERCHKGLCPPCLQMRMKKCRCGIKEKQVPCAKEFTCEVKCRRKRNCGNHYCNRKCCEGQCPACEQVCGKSLNCSNHKCNSLCHLGRCYPCPLTAQVQCRCGASVLNVPCGRERNAKPPRCRQSCQIAPDCHHQTRDQHHCHFGACPPCRQQCSKSLSGCVHQCQYRCHSAVLVDINAVSDTKAATPWEQKKPKMELRALPCPPCRLPVSVECVGKHEQSEFACSEAPNSYSCGRCCGQPLACGNHNCQKLCHKLNDSSDACEECEHMCSLPRKAGCTHPCPKACHSAPWCEIAKFVVFSPACRQSLRVACHCGLTQLFVKCEVWSSTTDDASRRRDMLRCETRCTRIIACGHHCSKVCHPPEEGCSSTGDCRKKVALFCKCKTKRLTVLCNVAHETTVECDDECRTKCDEKAKVEQKEREVLEAEQLTKKRREAEEMERKFGGSKKKATKRRVSTEDNRRHSWSQLAKYAWIPVLMAVIFYGLYLVLN